MQRNNTIIMKKAFFLTIVLIIYIAALIFWLDIYDNKQVMGSFVAYVFGLYYVFTYIFNLTMHAPGWTFIIGRHAIWRFLLFIMGGGLMIGVLLNNIK